MRLLRALRRERYPNFRNAQVERGPYYSGRAPSPLTRHAEWMLWIVAAVCTGGIIGWWLQAR